MRKLEELVEILDNNMESIVLKVKENSKIDLICLGFDGDEELFRVTKGERHTYTVWKKDGSHFSCEWGRGGYTLVSDNTTKQRKKIVSCIENYFDVYIDENVNTIKKTLYLERPSDVEHTFTFYWFENDNEYCIHKDGNYFARFLKGIALNKLNELGYTLIEKNSTITKENSGCYGQTYIMVRK